MRRLCQELGCPHPPTYRGRCRHHARQRERQVNRQGRNIYSTKRWKILRRRKLYETPLCEHEGCNEIATDVHHRHGVENDPWSKAGLESLCHSHHSQVTRSEMMAR